VSGFRVWNLDFDLAELSSLVTLGKLDNAAGTCGDHCIVSTNYLTVIREAILRRNLWIIAGFPKDLPHPSIPSRALFPRRSERPLLVPVH